MYNFSINFSNPLLLLLLIPAAALTLIPYFLLSKKYRKTRNRITSIVLHLLIMLFSISVLAGTAFSYQVPNSENEIILLVDVSDTSAASSERRDDFILTVLSDSAFDRYKVGIVTFGYDQVYAAPLTSRINDIYNQYSKARLPDTSATDIASALEYTSTLFNNPDAAKIVLVTDGKETDRSAGDVIRYIAEKKIRVDVVNIPSGFEEDDVHIVNVERPEHHIKIDEECLINVTVHSKAETNVVLKLFDNGELSLTDGTQGHTLAPGTHTLVFRHVFTTSGLHEMLVQVESEDPRNDSLDQNNEYYSYIYLETFNKILIIESREGQSEMLSTMLEENGEFETDVLFIYSDNVPTTVDELRAYDQIILNNISNADMPEGFVGLLDIYVRVHGGGLLTVGGNDESGKANAYNRADMQNTLYQEMLPVQAVDYTPPLGVVVIIDRSGSMTVEDDATGATRLEWARAGAVATLSAMEERDYFGLMTLDSEHNLVLDMTPRTRQSEILQAIDSVRDAGGATVFPGAIERAGQLLMSANVSKRHIVLVTDGGVPENQREQYEFFIEENYRLRGITMSIVLIGSSASSNAGQVMQNAVDLGKGKLYPIMRNDFVNLMNIMRNDINTPALKEVNIVPFAPIIDNPMSLIVRDIERGTEQETRNRMTVELGGFYGVRVRSDEYLVLTGDFEVPLYAHWKYGKGTVGSFMCDLNGTWSAEFMADVNGQRFISNAINYLMPTEDIRPHEINFKLTEDNYTNSLSIFTSLENGQSVSGQVTDIETGGVLSLNAAAEKDSSDEFYVISPLTASNNYSRASFVIKRGGNYKITLTKKNADGLILAEYEAYKSFSFSREYDTLMGSDAAEIEDMLGNIAEVGRGSLIADPEHPGEIFAFISGTDVVFDPRETFMIIVLVLFLTDIAVRKFKFKWPHELWASYKRKLSERKKYTKAAVHSDSTT